MPQECQLSCSALPASRPRREPHSDSSTVDDCTRGDTLKEVRRVGDAANAYVKGLGSANAAKCKASLKALPVGDDLYAEAEVSSSRHRRPRRIDVIANAANLYRERAAATSPRRTWLWIGSASKDAGNAILLGLVGVILAVLLVWRVREGGDGAGLRAATLPGVRTPGCRWPHSRNPRSKTSSSAPARPRSFARGSRGPARRPDASIWRRPGSSEALAGGQVVAISLIG